MRFLRLIILTAVVLSVPSLLWAQWFWQQPMFDPTGINLNLHGTSTRARGMGNAYLAISDDVGGATWNPAGAAYLENGEGVVEFLSNASDYDNNIGRNYSFKYNTNDNIFSSFGYLSPLRFYNRDYTVGINYYRLFDFSRDYDVNVPDRREKYYNKFGVEVVKLTAATKILPNVSFGINGNIYIRGFSEDYIQHNPPFYWIIGNDTTFVPYHYHSGTSFRGINFDFGLQGRFGGLNIGAVVSTPFKLRQESTIKNTVVVPDYGEQGNIITQSFMKYDFPFGYSGGASYTLNKLTLSADISYYQFSKSRNSMNPYFADAFYPYSWDPSVPNEDYNPYWADIMQYRFGAEYLIDVSNLTIPIRAGYRNDPKIYSDGDQFYASVSNNPLLPLPPGTITPYGGTEFNTDNQVVGYVVSFGSGLKYKIYRLDVAYEYGHAERNVRNVVVALDDIDNDYNPVWGDKLSDYTRKINENLSKLYISLTVQF